MSRRHPVLASLALVGVTAVVAASSMPAAYAAEDEPVVTNRETVQAYLDATGDVKVARIYDQLAAFGNGTITVENPVSGKGLRNLNGFGRVDVEDGRAVQKLEVDGEARLRTLSDFEGDLPVDVIVAYSLNGKSVKPSDIVGKSGLVEVHYTVKNVTGEMREVTYTNGAGETVNESVEVPIPLVGSLSTTLPSSFTDVQSDEAAVAGDGRGGTKLSFTMTLFPPIGSDTIEFGYAAQVEDAELPPAAVSIVPVQPLQSPSFKGGAESYKGGAESGAELTAGATEIDANLLKLRDGAAELLSGLILLSDGASELSGGLNDEAAPGSEELADGADQAADGADELSDGLNGKAAPGAQTLAGGAALLNQKLGTFQQGLGQLYTGVSSLPSNPDYQRLLAGIRALNDGLGAPDKAGTVRFGLAQLQAGIKGSALPGLEATRAGVERLRVKIEEAIPDVADLGKLATDATSNLKKVAVMDGCLNADGSDGPEKSSEKCVAVLSSLNNAGTLSVAIDHDPIPGQLPDGGLKQQLTAAEYALNGHGPVSQQDPGGIQYAMTSLIAGLDDHAPGKYGPTDKGGALYALGQLAAGVDGHKPGTFGPNDPGGLQYGLGAVEAGVQQLAGTVIAQVTGALGTPTSDPEKSLRGGAAALNNGAGQLAGGAKDLAAGLNDAAAGAEELADGNEQIADGADELADGLGEAAVGSKRLAEGLGEAATGAPELVDGAERLSTEGTQQLVAAGEETTVDYGKRYAMIKAGAERAETEAMPYGAPEGAIGTAAYSLEIDGVTAEGSRNVQRGLGALVAFGGALGLTALVRRRLA